MPYFTAANGLVQWIPWENYFMNSTSTTDPISATFGSFNSAFPWFFMLVMGVIYLILFHYFADNPSKYKFVGIAALVMIISLFLTVFGLLPTAILNIVIFLIALAVSGFFKRT